MRKLVAYTAALMALASPTIALSEALPSPFLINLGDIDLIECTTKRGTGVRIDEDLLLTAAHVVSEDTCSVRGAPVELIYFNGDKDVAVVRTKGLNPSRMTYTCSGFKRGETYFAVGWAGGTDLVVNRVRATGLNRQSGDFKGLAVLRGLTFHGMSGGAVVNQDGELVGLVNAGNSSGLSLSRPLTDLYLCGAKA